MAIMIPEAVEGASGAAGAATGARASRARGNRVRKPHVVQVSSSTPARASSSTPASPSSRQAGGGGQKKSSVRKYYGYGKKGYTTSKPAFKALTGREYGGVMLAEYLAGILILAVAMIIRGWSNGYLTVMTGFITRATALTGVFFILFLLGPTKAGKAAMYFGALVDLAILFTATQQNVFSDVAKVVQGQALTTDTATVEANTTMDEPKPGLTFESTS